jgi:hypothetical protein
MPSPRNIEEKIERMINAWRTLAPAKSFGGMTLAQFEAAASPSREARQRIDELDARLKQEIAARDAAAAEFNIKAQLVVTGVLADPTEGPDSALYEALGDTRKSERKSGLSRKRDEPAVKQIPLHERPLRLIHRRPNAFKK